MKTKLLTLATIALIALNVSGALAETCKSGSLQTGENGHVYCTSIGYQINWWSAYTWCEAQGRHLASIYEVCPGWPGNDSSCNMGTFTSGSTFWTSTAEGTETAFRISKSGAGRYNRNLALAYAICY